MENRVHQHSNQVDAVSHNSCDNGGETHSSHSHDAHHGYDTHHDHDAHHHHHHAHSHVQGVSDNATEAERSVALLAYMADHNASHVDEIRNAAQNLQGDAAALVSEAADLMQQGATKLAEALSLVKGE